MIDNFLVVAGQVAVLFVLMGVGAVLRRAKLIAAESIDGMINLLLLVVTPCLIVDVFQRPFSPEMLKGLVLAFLIASAGHVVAIAISCLTVRHRDDDTRRPLLLSAVFSNAGFMGIPLEQAILGDSGVFYGIVYVVVFNLFMWSWGLRVMSRQGTHARGARLKMFVNPGTVGIAIGLPVFFLSLKFPDIVSTPIHLLAGLNTPLAMVVIGYCLFGAKLGKVVRMPAVYVVALVRLVVYPLLMVLVLRSLSGVLDRTMMLAIVIAASAPVAAMVSMFASKFARDVDTSVAVVSGTTLLSIITMPVVIALAMSVL